jgi:hypothetical protein
MSPEEVIFQEAARTELKLLFSAPARDVDAVIKTLLKYKIFQKKDLMYLDEKAVNSISALAAQEVLPNNSADEVLADVTSARLRAVLKKACEEAVEGKNLTNQAAWSTFTSSSENFYGGPISSKITPEQSLVHVMSKSPTVYRELKVTTDTTNTSEYKPSENSKGEIVLTRSVVSGKPPKSFAELVSVVIPWLVALQSELKMRKGAVTEEYLSRLAMVARKKGDLAAVRFDSCFRSNLQDNARRLADERGLSMGEATLRWLICGNDEEAKSESIEVAQNSQTNSKILVTDSKMCQYYREDCFKLKTKTCDFKPLQHATKPQGKKRSWWSGEWQ